MKRLLPLAAALLALAGASGAPAPPLPPPSAGLERQVWTGAALADFALHGVVFDGVALALEDGALTGEAVGEWTPERAARELLPGWNASTPPGASVEVSVQALFVGGGESPWYRFGEWGSTGTEQRSVPGQRDPDGAVLTDELRLTRDAAALRVRVRLRAGVASPRVSLLSLTAHRPPVTATRPQGGPLLLPVPELSQLAYPGGAVLCSPTALAMLLAHHGTAAEVPALAAAVYDHDLRGAGNWAFNMAQAGELGHRAYPTRLGSLAEAERYLRSGLPLALSLSWRAGELPGAHLSASTGHLLVLRGFTASGDAIVNDPYAPPGAVRRTYPRAALERLWLGHGGVAYLVLPREN